MDWTGGVRRRFAPGKQNGTIHKQKAHFAKARSALQNPPKSTHSSRGDIDNPLALSRQGLTSLRAGGASRHQGDTRGTNNPSVRRMYSADPQHLKRQTDAVPVQDFDIVHITSSSAPSSPGSIRTHHHSENYRPIHPPHKKPLLYMAEEERLLRANKRRLLARPDWLGLNASKPVHMRFKSQHDKDRIGKRRKVAHSTSRKGQAAVPRLLTPLFDHRLVPGEHEMSGALQAEDFQVRIGTDAFASQTVHSRRSHDRRQASVRPFSTDFGPLSEEPMLHGSDGDSFEALDQPDTYANDHHALGTRPVVPLTLQNFNDSGQSPMPRAHHIQRPVEVARMVPLEEGHQHVHAEALSDEAIEQTFYEMEAVQDREPVPMSVNPESRIMSPFDSERGRPENYADHEIDAIPHDTKATTIGIATTDEHLHRTDDDSDELFWQRLMVGEKHTSSKPSNQALKSSSLHNTNSDSEYRPDLKRTHEQPSAYYKTQSTPKGAGTQGSPLLTQPHPPTADPSSKDMQSPSASLAQIMKLADQPEAVATHPEEDNDDAAWRQFIIGSEVSSPASTTYVDKNHLDSEIAPLEDESGPEMSLLDVSDLGTSDKATAGGTQHTTGIRGDSVAHEHDMPKLTTMQQALSAAAVHGTDVDEIEDEIEGIDTKRPRHALTRTSKHATRVLNPKRFKSSKQQKKDVVSKTWTSVGRKKATGGLKRQPKVKKHRSVYDLVDSDGESV